MPDLTLIATTLQSLFTDHAICLAQQTGLVQRRSKLSGPLILLVLVAGFIQHPDASYNILAQVAADYDVNLTRQAIQQRLTIAAVTFFQALFEKSLQLLQTQCRLSIPVLDQFSAIYLLDSSQVAVPTAMITQYPGTGGDGPKAGVKWQVLWEVLAGNLHHILGQPAKQSDHRYREYMDWVSAGSLILFDLGYVALPALQQLVSREAYFICRWNPRFEAFTSEGKPFDLRAHLVSCLRLQGQGQQLDFTLRVGVRAQLPLRVVAFHLPPAICEQRRRRANATERKRGFTYTAEYKMMLDWNVYITNVAPEQLTSEQLGRVYRLRWQVELLFKLWKSQAELANVRGKQSGRVLCEMYAKLIGLAIFGYLSAPVRLTDFELSAVQAWQVLQRQIERVASALHTGITGTAGTGQDLQQALTLVYQRWEQFAQRQLRPDRPTTFRQLQREIVISLT